MTFQDQIALDMAVFYDTDEFGEAATYAGAEITVVEAAGSEQATGDPGFMQPTFSIYVKSSDVAQPKAGDAVVFRTVTCTVQHYPRLAGDVWLVNLVKNTVQ